MRNQLFWNRGRPEGFYDVTTVAGPAMQKEAVGRGAAFGDYDNDGDIDAFVVNHGAPGVLLRNDGGNSNRWMQVELRGTKSNRQGIGATVRVVAGGRSDARQIGSQSSYLSQNSLIETYGLGATGQVDTVEVRWPSGARDVRVGVAANQRLTIVEAGTPTADRTRIQDFWRLYREATAERVAGRVQAAERSYAAALELNPEHEDVLYYLGGMRLELGDFAAAAAAWRRLASLNANSARTQSQLATLYFCLEPGAPFQLDSAEVHLRRAHEINKEENGPILRLGEVALLRHDSAAARRQFLTVLATHANNGPARFYMGYLEWKAGNLARAREEFAKGSSAVVTREAVAGVASEGDTKSGAVAAVARGRCDDLRSLSEVRNPADKDPGMIARYRSLDSLLTAAAARAR
jgi:hypothetical protein